MRGWAGMQGEEALPKTAFQGHTKDLLVRINFTTDFLLSAVERQLWAQHGRGQRCSGPETRCHPGEKWVVKEMAGSSSCFEQRWKSGPVSKSGEPANTQSLSHNKIIFITGLVLCFPSAKWDYIQVRNGTT